MRFSILCTLALVGTASVTLDAQAIGKRRQGRCESSNRCCTPNYSHSQCGRQGGYATAGYSTGAYALTHSHGTVMPMPMPPTQLVTPGQVTNAAGQTTTTTGSGVVQTSGTTTLSTTDTPMPMTTTMTYSPVNCQNFGEFSQVNSRNYRRGLFRR